jgi:DNA-binding transcriptional MerR regulator
MLISELSRRTGVAVPTLKFYLREKLLMPGRATSATRAEYDETHVRRVGVVRALTESVGVSVQQARRVLELVDHPHDDLFDTLGQAIAALPPTAPSADDYPRARAVLARLGQVYDPAYPAVAQLERALADVENAGMPLDDDRLAVYGPHVRAIAEFELSRSPADPAEAVEYAVLGTALYEPVIAALRRLAHRAAAAELLDAADGAGRAIAPPHPPAPGDRAPRRSS